MTKDGTLRVFVSAVSDELESYRRKVVDVLHRKQLEVRDQEHFSQGPATLIERLRDYIQQCDVLIALVGERCGAFPADKEAAALGSVPVFDEYCAATRQASASYTQWEFFLAQQQGKQIYVFITDKGFVPDAPNPENADRYALQQAYREWIKQSGKHYDKLTDLPTLTEDVLVLPFLGREEERAYMPIRLRLKPDEVKKRFDDQIVRGEIMRNELKKPHESAEDFWYEMDSAWDKWREKTKQILNECYSSTEPLEWLEKDVRVEHVSTDITSSGQIDALRGDFEREIRFLKLLRGRLRGLRSGEGG